MVDREREPTPQEALEQAREEVRDAERAFWAQETGIQAWDEGTEEAQERAWQMVKAQLDEAQARLAAAEAVAQAQQVTVPEAAERMGTSMGELAEAQELAEAEDAAQAWPYKPEGVDTILDRMDAERTPAEAEADRAAVAARRQREHQEALAVRGIATTQEIVEAEDAAQAEQEPASSFRDEHIQVVAVGGGPAHEAAERLRREIAGADVTTVEQVEDLEFAEADERAEQADIAMFDLASVPEIIEAGNAEDAAQAERAERARLAELESARAARAAQLAAYYAPQPEMPGMGMEPGFEREM